MSQENVEIVRRIYAAFDRGDTEGLVQDFAADFVLHDATRLDAGTYRGRAGILQWLAEWGDMWEDWRVVTERFIDLEDKVLVLCRQWARGKGSQVEVEQAFAQLWTVKRQKLTSMEYFLDYAKALEAAGLRESGG